MSDKFYSSVDLLTALAIVASDPKRMEARVCYVFPDKVVQYAWYHGPCFLKANIGSHVHKVSVAVQFIPYYITCRLCGERFE